MLQSNCSILWCAYCTSQITRATSRSVTATMMHAVSTLSSSERDLSRNDNFTSKNVQEPYETYLNIRGVFRQRHPKNVGPKNV